MTLLLKNIQNVITFDVKLLEKHVNLLRHFMGVCEYNLSVLCVDNSYIQNLNRAYRNRNEPTDILSFPFLEDLNCDKSLPLPDDPEERDLGDIVLGVQYIHSHCQKQGVPLQYMLPVMVTHGLCHLVGHDHETEEQWQKMIKKELYILEQFNKMTGYTCTPLVDVGH